MVTKEIKQNDLKILNQLNNNILSESKFKMNGSSKFGCDQSPSPMLP